NRQVVVAQWGGQVVHPELVYAPISKLMIGQYQEAIEIIQEQMRSGAPQPSDAFYIGLAQCDLGNADKATQLLNIANTGDHQDIANLFVAQLAIKQGDRAKALTFIGKLDRSDQADLLAPFPVLVLEGEFVC